MVAQQPELATAAFPPLKQQQLSQRQTPVAQQSQPSAQQSPQPPPADWQHPDATQHSAVQQLTAVFALEPADRNIPAEEIAATDNKANSLDMIVHLS